MLPTDTITTMRFLPTFSPAVVMGISISIATGLYGISFGALSVAAGLTVGQTAALSLLMFTGGSQFAFIGVISTGGSPAAACGAATLLYLRNAIYGAQMKALIAPKGIMKFIAAHVTIDESAGTASVQDTAEERNRGFWTAGVGVFVLWNVFTLVGALGGQHIGDPAQWGLDGAAVAAFLGLLWPRLTQRSMRSVALVAALITVLVLPVTPTGVPIVLAALVAGLWGWVVAVKAHSNNSLTRGETTP